MTSIPPDILEHVKDDFGRDAACDTYRYLLTKVPDGLPNGTRPRHLRCILFLAEGDRARLDEYIQMCHRDPRDLILEAEYAMVDEKLVQVRDFNRPFPEATVG